MATYTDIQADITSAQEQVTNLQNAISALQQANAGSITPAEADTLAQGIQGITSALSALVTSITPQPQG